MKIQALAIAAAIACGTAFAAAPNDTAKAPETDTAAAAQKAPAKHAVKKHAIKAHKVALHAKKHTQHMGASAAPMTDVNDNSRQARMDEALAKFRRTHS